MEAKHQRISRRRLKAVIIPLLSMLLASCESGSGPQAVGLNAGSSGYAVPTSTPSVDTSPWKLVWQDNFTGTGLPTGWTFDVGGYGFGDKQLQWNSDDNAQLSGSGGLVITATQGADGHVCWYGPCQYTSAKIETTFAQTYGRFEARIKLPAGTGLWPAFWMIPASTKQNPQAPGEIDIIEVNNLQPYLIKGYAHDADTFNYRAEQVLNFPPSLQFHTYGIDWTPSGITWTIDGHPYGHINSYRNWPFNQPFFMLLSLAVGGSWPGPPSAATVFPAQMVVSWVRVYKMVGLYWSRPNTHISRHSGYARVRRSIKLIRWQDSVTSSGLLEQPLFLAMSA